MVYKSLYVFKTTTVHFISLIRKALLSKLQYIDRTMYAYIFFLSEKEIKLKHVPNWFNLFIDYHNNEFIFSLNILYHL